MAELADALDSGSSEVTFVQVQVLLPAPSKGNEKDIAQETPDFIGGFAVSTVEIFTSDFVDVKKVFFAFCSEPNSRTIEYKPPGAWIRTNPSVTVRKVSSTASSSSRYPDLRETPKNCS